MTEAERQVTAFVTAARGYVGARWRHRGRKPWAVDCVGVLVLSARAAGWPVTDDSVYSRWPWRDRLEKELERQMGKAVLKESMQVGDAVLIQWDQRGPSHVGIVAGYKWGGYSLIHCENIDGCIEQRIDADLLEKIIRVYRPCAKFCQ